MQNTGKRGAESALGAESASGAQAKVPVTGDGVKTAADPLARGARVVNVSSCAHYFGELQVTSQSECSIQDL